jgi:anti-sigma-K factor RskA
MHGTMKLSEDTDLLVAEYVVGTLEHDERRVLEDIAAREPAVQAAVMVWERRLGPLHELIVPVTPPQTAWGQIEEKLESVEQETRPRAPSFFEMAAQLARNHGAEGAVELIDRLTRWRMIAIVSAAIAVALAAFVAATLVR